MLRGVNRRVVEITDPHSEFFERIYFVVKEDCPMKNMKSLHKEAYRLAAQNSGSVPPLAAGAANKTVSTVRVSGKTKRFLLSLLRYTCVAAIGSGILFVIQTLF